MMPFQPLSTPPRTTSLYDISEQQTLTDAGSGNLESITAADMDLSVASKPADLLFKKQYRSRVLAVVLIVALVGSIFWLWRPATASSPTPDAALPTVSATAGKAQDTTTIDGADGTQIMVYITGAVKHPGVYTIDNQARVYQLLQVAGGPLPGANLTALNLATHLSDGQEIYVLHANETPTAGGTSSTATSNNSNPGTKVNVNTASADELRQDLSISSTSAQAIVTYRLQHGPFLSVDTLAQVVSKTVYTKIKDMVTVS